MAKSPRNDDPRAERDDSQSAGTYVEVVGTPRRRKRGATSSAPKAPVHSDAPEVTVEPLRPPLKPKRESARPAAIPAEQIRLPSGAVAYVSPALPRSSLAHEEPRAERSPPSSELHLDAPAWVESGPTARNYPPQVSAASAPRAIREVVPRRIEDERQEIERASLVPSEARSSRVESVRPESTRPRASVDSDRHSSIPSESTRPRAVIDCIPDETTQARARLSAVQASLVLASKSDRPPAMSGSIPPPSPAGASVLDAKPQMVSDPPEQRRTSWALVGTVALLCSIISAAGVVAFKELQDGTVRMDRAVETKESARAATANVEAARSEEAAQAPVAQANVVPSASAPSVSPMPSVEQLPAATFNVAPPSADPTPPAAQPGEISPSAEQALAPPAQAAPAPAVALQIAPALSAPLSRAPSAPTALPSGGARKIGARAPAAAADTQQPAEGEGEVVALPSALTPSDTKTVLTQLADQERATAAAEEVKREEERKLPSTARLKAPSVRIEAARIAAALKKASQEAVARVNEEQAPAAAPAAVAPAAPAAPVAPPKAEPENAGTLPDNPF